MRPDDLQYNTVTNSHMLHFPPRACHTHLPKQCFVPIFLTVCMVFSANIPISLLHSLGSGLKDLGSGQSSSQLRSSRLATDLSPKSQIRLNGCLLPHLTLELRFQLDFEASTIPTSHGALNTIKSLPVNLHYAYQLLQDVQVANSTNCRSAFGA